MALVIGLNVVAAVIITGGLSLAMWFLYRGLGQSAPRTAVRTQRQHRPVPATARHYGTVPASGHTAWSAR